MVSTLVSNPGHGEFGGKHGGEYPPNMVTSVAIDHRDLSPLTTPTAHDTRNAHRGQSPARTERSHQRRLPTRVGTIPPQAREAGTPTPSPST